MTAVETSPELKLERAEELVRQLTAALSARRIYPSDHSRSKEATEAVARSLSTYFNSLDFPVGLLRETARRIGSAHHRLPLR